MDYHRIYKQLINKAAERTISGYKERHHIIPKCMGGNNDKDNIVDLTAREHFVAHMLLCKIYPDNKSLVYALWAFVHWGRTSGDVKRFYKISSRQYSVIRELYSKVNKGGWDNPKRKKWTHTVESKRKISESKKGSNNPNFGKKIPLDRIKKQIESRAGYTHSDSTKKKMSESKLGKIRGPHTTEHKANISKSGLGRRYSQPIIQCPICYITGPKGAMTRYHLPNCK
jgi:hypothetical protein